ncbi:hypothetical protein JOD54_001531 [Actinokineospora baliensis]|uniref:hypothetical protein n=1 Tax=Actinokineospora baliensis TaxID=547056 RepID=UPI001956ECD2|nr:hypothetical protein [Actinokineospora baliensis]MBM7771327.1 hypothetical protein [Actinokineospora baliensis]
MYVIRPAEAADRDGVADLVHTRAEWMRDQGIGRWRGWVKSAEHLADQVAEPD